MAGICKKCGGPTTNTRAKSKNGLCFKCEHDIPPTSPNLEEIREFLDEQNRISCKYCNNGHKLNSVQELIQAFKMQEVSTDHTLLHLMEFLDS